MIKTLYDSTLSMAGSFLHVSNNYSTTLHFSWFEPKILNSSFSFSSRLWLIFIMFLWSTSFWFYYSNKFVVWSFILYTWEIKSRFTCLFEITHSGSMSIRALRWTLICYLEDLFGLIRFLSYADSGITYWLNVNKNYSL